MKRSLRTLTGISSMIFAIVLLFTNVEKAQSQIIVSVKAYLQGMWNGSAHVITPVAVELRSGTTLFTSTLVARNVAMISTTGTINAQFNGVVSGDYWLIVRAAAYAAVASANPITMTAGVPLSYDFTDAASKAANSGTNAVIVNSTTYFMLKGGDLNGNNAVNPTDLNIFKIGYQKSNTGVPVD